MTKKKGLLQFIGEKIWSLARNALDFNITEITEKTFNINLARIHLWMPMITGAACVPKIRLPSS